MTLSPEMFFIRIKTLLFLSLFACKRFACKIFLSIKNFKIALMTSFTLLLKTGIIEGIDIENNTEVGKKCYMPHSAVVREDKDTTKLRIVYDASSKSKDLSLNESLDYEIKGLSNLLRILVRFSVRKIRIIRDIEKAFLRIAMKGENGDVLRFNWIKNVTSR